MRHMLARLILAVTVILITLAFGLVPRSAASDPAQADGRSLVWERYDVRIDEFDTAANRFRVTETYRLRIDRGPFTFGTASIPTDRLERIESMAVYDNDQPLRQSCDGRAGTYCVTTAGGSLDLEYHFTSPAQTGTTRTIALVYVVRGALRSYEGGDQLYWVAIPEGLPFPVLSASVTVTLPADRPPEIIGSYPDEWPHVVDGTTITWTAPRRLSSRDWFEVRVQYPHDPAMSRPGWQRTYDFQREYEETWQPLVSVILIALGLLIAIVGALFVYTRYAKHGRDPAAVVVPEYLSEPPSDERPGVVGVLLDERADMKDVMGTLVDLAQRGYLTIEQTQTGGVFGMFEKTEFVFHREDKSTADLRPYEITLLDGVFGSKRTVQLSDLRNKFYKKIPAIKEQLYREQVAQGYFKRAPNVTRNLWLAGAIGLIVLAGGLFFVGIAAAETVSPFAFMPGFGLGITGVALLLASQFMPAKTDKGAQEAAKWRAFRRYLQNVERYSDVAEAAKQFDRYMGYAVVFGLEQKWVNTCAPVLTSMPTWYFPTYLGGPWDRGYRPGHRTGPMTSGGPGGLGDINLGGPGGGLAGSFSGPGGLNEMSRSLTDGLNAMSRGMTQMLNDASRVMTSQPSSSGSKGGGWSGGGFSGGGGSGGGSRGFG